eukprot:scaffold60248_cov41-Cyclotella_meneghiniana.AAC.1
MSTAAQRKAWNEAMKSAGAVLPPPHGVSTDRRRARRDKARKSTAYGGAGNAAGSSDERAYRVALHMDMLEGAVADNADAEEDEEYNELEELDEDDDHDDVANTKRGTAAANKKKSRRKRLSAATSASIPKYLKARSLASILIEEANRSDSVASQYVNAAVSSSSSSRTKTTTSSTRKFCPVTGLYGTYTDPKSGIPYASLKALEQIRERAPPWMNNSGGSGAYWEACKTLRNDG